MKSPPFPLPPTKRRGLRAIAVFEALKGLLVLAAGCGALALMHRDAQAMAEELIGHFHLNPASDYPRIFLMLAARADDTILWLLALAAFGYATLRLSEAYGLWRDRGWASWLGALSGAIYIPIEIVEFVREPSALHAGLLAANAAIVTVLGLRLAANR